METWLIITLLIIFVLLVFLIIDTIRYAIDKKTDKDLIINQLNNENYPIFKYDDFVGVGEDNVK